MKVAFGRHYGDVPPNKGTYRGKAKESIEVAVHTEVLTTIPPELAAERVQSLPIPTYPAGAAVHREAIHHQPEQQQQGQPQ